MINFLYQKPSIEHDNDFHYYTFFTIHVSTWCELVDNFDFEQYPILEIPIFEYLSVL